MTPARPAPQSPRLSAPEHFLSPGRHRVSDFAHGAALAASANVSASDVGNALGARLGGLAITAGFGHTSPLYVGAGIAPTSWVVMVVAARQAAEHDGSDT